VYASVAGSYDITIASSNRSVCLVANFSRSPVCGVYNQGRGVTVYQLPFTVGKNVVSLEMAADPATISYIQVVAGS